VVKREKDAPINWPLIQFLGAFRIVAKSAYYLRQVLSSNCRLSVCLSVCPLVSARLPLNRFQRNLILDTFMKFCVGNANLFKIGQKYRAL
jgi:hypothetical protein